MEKTTLQLAEEATYKRYEELRELVREEERSVIIPQLKSRYENKYFKGVLNGILIYSFVTSVNHSQKFEAKSFHLPEREQDFYFEYRFGNTQALDYVLQEEITKDEFYAAYRQFDDKVKSILI